MDIQGLQKMTLLDYPGKVACTVFLSGCDFRCPFCHNSELWSASAPSVMDEDALMSFLNRRRGLLDGVVITGGEPLLRRDLPELLGRIREMGFSVKLDTNGSHPERLMALISQGLVDYVAMDIKNDPSRYAQTAGLSEMDLHPVRESAEILLEGKVDGEFRTTVAHPLHDEASFHGIGEWIRGAKRCFLQAFVDRDTVLYAGLSAPTREEMNRYADILRQYVREVSLRGVE